MFGLFKRARECFSLYLWLELLDGSDAASLIPSWVEPAVRSSDPIHHRTRGQSSTISTYFQKIHWLPWYFFSSFHNTSLRAIHPLPAWHLSRSLFQITLPSEPFHPCTARDTPIFVLKLPFQLRDPLQHLARTNTVPDTLSSWISQQELSHLVSDLLIMTVETNHP